MNDRKNIVFVNRFYWPDEPATAQLLTDLAESLVVAGHTVNIVTSQPANPPLPTYEAHNGVLIHRVPGLRFKHNNVLLKALAFLSFARGALRTIDTMLKPGDVLVVMTDPPLLGVFAASLARKRGAHLVHWLQDVYPEIAMAVGGAWFARIFRSKRDRAWQAADVCVAPGEDIADLVRAHGANPATVLVSPNWAPAGLEAMPANAADALRRDWGLTGKFIVMYSGNLGRVHDLHPVLAIAEELRGETDIVFLFVGGGAQRACLQATAERRGLRNVIFKPAQPRHRLGLTLALANIHLVTLRTGCEQLVFPSKIYGITAVGRPVLYIGPKNCELARTVEIKGFGRSFARGETKSAIQTILHLRHAPTDCVRMSKTALAFSQETGGLSAAVSTWDRLLNGLKSLAPASPPPQK